MMLTYFKLAATVYGLGTASVGSLMLPVRCLRLADQLGCRKCKRSPPRLGHLQLATADLQWLASYVVVETTTLLSSSLCRAALGRATQNPIIISAEIEGELRTEVFQTKGRFGKR